MLTKCKHAKIPCHLFLLSSKRQNNIFWLLSISVNRGLDLRTWCDVVKLIMWWFIDNIVSSAVSVLQYWYKDHLICVKAWSKTQQFTTRTPGTLCSELTLVFCQHSTSVNILILWALYTQYFPESCEQNRTQAYYSGGIRTHDP